MAVSSPELSDPSPKIHDVYTLIGTLQQIPPDNDGGHELESKEISVNDAGYDEAMTAVREAVPDGWRLLHVRGS